MCGADVTQAAEHDFDVIVRTPSALQLNHLSRADKYASGTPGDWYDVLKYRDVCPTPKPTGADGQPTNCDEYPFYSS